MKEVIVCFTPYFSCVFDLIWTHLITHKHIRYDPTGRGIGPSQQPIYKKNLQSKETDIHAPATLEPAIPASERRQTRALHRTTTGTGK